MCGRNGLPREGRGYKFEAWRCAARLCIYTIFSFDSQNSFSFQMACLEAAFAERKEASNQKKAEGAQKVRLVANPLVTVSQLEDVLHSFLKHRQTGDLLSLVCPPPAGPCNFGWHTPPSGPWLSKAIGLLYDLVGLAENTKLHSSKVMKAMQNLQKMNVLTVTGKPEDVLDKCDLCIRVLMAMLRTAKTNENLRSRAFRLLIRDEQVKIEMTLDRVSLPPAFWVPEDEEKPKGALMGDMFQDDARGSSLSIVPAQQGSAQKMPQVSTGVGSGEGWLQMPAIFARLDGQEEDAKAGGGSLGGSRAELDAGPEHAICLRNCLEA